MCGIAGVFSGNPGDHHATDVMAIVDDQRPRGPDFQATMTIQTVAGSVILGHDRLSIIDLSPAGNQPMWDWAHEVCVVLNGEIYNYLELRNELLALGHRFVSSSDTEVILEAFKRWGIEALSRFNGMFAFTLFDTRDETMYLVRDRFGVKPLYYTATTECLHFASTARTMAQVLGLEPSLEYLSCGVRYGLWEHDDAAPYAGMKALRPGHWLRVRKSAVQGLDYTLRQYYDFDASTSALAESLSQISIQDALERMQNTLDDAVRIRLRADVPVAISLSGGLDSSSVAALAAQHHQGPLRGFTFGNPGNSDSEGPLVSEFSKMTGVAVTYLWPSMDGIIQSFDDTVDAQVGPYVSGSMMAQYLVFQAARADGFKVLLGGQGGDEAFMGYHKFQVFFLRHLLAKKDYVRAMRFVASLVPSVAAERSIWTDTWKHRHRYLRKSGLGTVLRLPDASLNIGYSPSEPLRKRQAVDIAVGSLPTLLRYEDSNSMGNSIESRLPFLDYRVMEFGVALPESLKLHQGRGKWIVRETMKGKLPETIRNPRYKRGFDIQQGSWIDRGLGDHIRARIDRSIDRLGDYVAAGSDVAQIFSNEELKHRPSAFAEATSLIWLADLQKPTASKM